MEKRFSSILEDHQSSESPADLLAYSFCAADFEAVPDLVLWPESTEQTARIMRDCNHTRTSVVIRGSGTSRTGGCIGERAIIISTERMNRILGLDIKNKTVEVQAGMRVSELNLKLSEFRLTFPFVPFNPTATIGGMLALNQKTKESERQGSIACFIDEIEFVDGTGKTYSTHKIDLVKGKEGTTGIITKLKLRLQEPQSLSIDIFFFSEPSELIGKVRSLKNDCEAYFIEFLDKEAVRCLMHGEGLGLIVAYSSLKGKSKTVIEIREILQKLGSLHSSIMRQGNYFVMDPSVDMEKAYDLISWCDSKRIRLHGHAGLNQYYAYFGKDETDKMRSFRGFIKSINGRLGCSFGIGSANQDFLSTEEKKSFVKLKDEYDYNNILNPGKVIFYR